MRRGWFKEPRRHSLAARGIKTRQNPIHNRMNRDVNYRPKQNHVATRLRTAAGARLTVNEADMLQRDFSERMEKLGIRYDSDFRNQYSTWKTSQFRHTESVNRFTQTGRKTNVLSWDDWVNVNNAMNESMNKFNISGNVNTLGGKFKVREGNQTFTEDDWEHLAYENVGSVVEPVQRKDYIERA